ncbi:MAG: hypothetical protein RRB13_15250 [bacterium]|nr:hypothetical protein [bacterium]
MKRTAQFFLLIWLFVGCLSVALAATKPTVDRVSRSSNALLVYWTAAADHTYQIRWHLEGESFAAHPVAANLTSPARIEGIPSGQVVYFQLEATDAGGATETTNLTVAVPGEESASPAEHELNELRANIELNNLKEENMTFKGWSWMPSLMLSYDQLPGRISGEVTIDETTGEIRAKNQGQAVPRIAYEFHNQEGYFVNILVTKLDDLEKDIKNLVSDGFNGAGVGKYLSYNSNAGMNVGVGFFVERNVPVFRDGYSDGGTATGKSVADITRTETRGGVFISVAIGEGD